MENSTDEKYIRRCFELAKKAGKNVKSNPQVGAVIVHKSRIIGEGYHQEYGAAHAEVNAIKSVSLEDQKLLSESTLYVSLEPCCIHRKTPACTDLILECKIPKVVCATTDPNPEVAGAGMDKLSKAGIIVKQHILEEEGEILIRPFKRHLAKRPYIIVKFAQSQDHFISAKEKQSKISNQYTDHLVHKWRSEADGILIGTNTAIIDDPMLNNRLYSGSSPKRIIIDRSLKIPKSHKLWTDQYESYFISESESSKEKNKEVIQMNFDDKFWDNLLEKCFDLGVYRLLIEGGTETINTLVKSGNWDEARIITSPIKLESGVKAPILKGKLIESFRVNTDLINIIFKHMYVN